MNTRSHRLQRAPRAPRFPVHVPVRYRSVGAEHWSQGRIENISRSGVLFWSTEALPVETPLEMLFVLPFVGAPPGVMCRGHVVRANLGGDRGATPSVAVAISRYRFVRGASLDS